MRGGRRLVRGGEPTSAGRFDVASAGGRLHFRRPGTRGRDVARHALLQQQFAGLDDRLGMEALPHHAVEKSVGDGDDRHALMMRHEGSHDGDAFALRHARRRIVQRIVKAVAALRADLGQTRQIGRGRARIDHRRQSGGVGGDHPIFAETPLQPEAGNAEVRILVSELQVAGVVSGFGYAPGQAQLRGVIDLAAHDQTVGLFEQASRRRAHDERGHQILEHRSRPRNQRGAMRYGRRGAAEPEPMLGGDVAFGDRKEAGEPRLGSQEIVAVRIERAFRREKSDRQQLAVAVEQETEVHRERHRPRRAFEDREPRLQGAGGVLGPREILAVSGDRGQACLRPEQHIGAAAVAAFDRERPGDVGHRLGVGGHADESRREFVVRKRRLSRGERPPRRARRQAGAGSRSGSGRRRASGRIPRKLCRERRRRRRGVAAPQTGGPSIPGTRSPAR